VTTRAERVVFAGENDCRIESFECPEPAVGEVLIRNRASLISTGTELAVLRKRHRAYVTGGAMEKWIEYPFYPGYAAVGEIAAIGTGVEGIAIGDLVWHPGGHATYLCLPASSCKPVPAGVMPADAVFFGLAEIAMTALRRAPSELGERVLVSGQGLVGMLCARLYALSGASVTVADPSAGRLARNASFAFDRSLDLGRRSLGEWYQADDAKPELTIEAAGVESNIDACLKVTDRGGRVVLLGSPRKAMEIDPYNDIHLKGLTVIGAHGSSVPQSVRLKDHSTLFELCGGPLQLASIRSHEISFREAADVYDQLETNVDEYLAVVLTFPED
jgi:2-desacetyl-2-hydroxyethyl bacteriochlorophyllide A dehydrogenase